LTVIFGLCPPLAPTGGRGPRARDRKQAYARRALADLDRWLARKIAA
jgi:hypothetical protein